jgi:nucleotide-binding universal stress UspA family protein
MKKILVPTDGSECSNLAIDQAKEFAMKFDSEVVLLHVTDSSAAYTLFNPVHDGMNPTTGSMAPVGNMAVPLPAEHQKILDKISKDILASAKARLTVLGDKVTAHSMEGKPADTIIDYVENNDVDLVIMGSHGMGGFKRFFIGSITHKVMLSIDQPILIIR